MNDPFALKHIFYRTMQMLLLFFLIGLLKIFKLSQIQVISMNSVLIYEKVVSFARKNCVGNSSEQILFMHEFFFCISSAHETPPPII